MPTKPDAAYRKVLLAFAVLLLTALAFADHPYKAVLADFDYTQAPSVAAVDATNSPAAGPSNSVATVVNDGESNRLKITDSDGGINGVVITFPGAITAPGYYLFTADLKVENTGGAIDSFGMAAVAGGPSTVKILDTNAGYIPNLVGTGDEAKGFQTVGAAIDVPAGGTFPQDVSLYFSTDVSGNNYNAIAGDGSFAGKHRATAVTWPADSTSAVYVDNIKRIGPGNFGEERHLWVSVGDGFTDLTKLENILVKAKQNNFNCIDILARYRADAYYVPNRTDKTYANAEPFGSRIGTKTVSADIDPLQYAIDRGHELGLKVYISYSCFLVTPNSTYPTTLPSNSIMYFYNAGTPRAMTMTDSGGSEGLWADPSRSDVRDYTRNVLMDIVKNYDIDGVIFDRVRYPNYSYSYNPQGLADMGITGTPAVSDATFRNARRDAVTTFIHDCYQAVTDAKPWVVVGATPIATMDSLGDTYNQYMQYWPKWTARETGNRVTSFGCVDLLEPQLYRQYDTTPPWAGPAANTTLLLKTLFGDRAVYSLDLGVMPGASLALSPLFYKPSSGDPASSFCNAQNITDARDLGVNGVGVFSASTTIADMASLRDPSASTAGVDVLATPPTFNDYFMKAGYDKIPPTAVKNFAVAVGDDGQVTLSWDQSDPSTIDGDVSQSYLVYRSATSPVKEYWANRVTKAPLPGRAHWEYKMARGSAATYYYKVVPFDDYNNAGPATELGPFTVPGDVPPPADIIVDNTQAAFTGSWITGTSSTDKYGADYNYKSAGTGAATAVFTAAIQQTGTYDVYEWHPQGTNRASNAQHIITYAGGSTTALVNQQVNGGKWNKIATLAMNAGQNYTVTINDAFTGTNVMADGIKWAFVPPAPPAPPTPADQIVDNTAATVVGTWTTASSATDKYGTNYIYASKGTGSRTAKFTAAITADGLYDVYEWHSAGTNRGIDTPHAITFDGGSATVAVNQQVNGGKWNKLGTYTLRANSNYTVTISDALSVAGQLAMADGIKWVYSGPIPAGLPADVIVDNPAAVRTGTWTTGTSSTDKFGADYYSRSKGTGTNKVTFTGSLVQDGYYDVYEWHPAGANRAKDAPYSVSSIGGVKPVVVDQTVNGGKWNKLGNYMLTAGSQTVVIDDTFTSGDVIMADAVKWVYTGPLPATPGSPWDLIATPVSQTEVVLIWDGRKDNETGYVVERNGVQIAQLPATAEMYLDSGLTADTEYTYAVRATIGDLQSCISNMDWARTLPNPPAAPAGLSTSVISQTEISLAWSDVEGETAYEVLRNGAVIVTLPADSVSYADSGLTADTAYTYAVVAKNTGGKSPESAAVTETTLPNPPDAPTGLTAVAKSQTEIVLTWVDNASNETAYEVVRDGQVITTLAADAVSYTDANLKDATAYSYAVRATNKGGKSADSNVASETTLPYPPDAPTALTAVAKSQTEIVLAWVDNANNETAYEVVRDGQVVATLAADAVSYTDAGLKDATAYSYVVRATNKGGKSEDSNAASETTLPYPPAAPAGLTAVAKSQTEIVLSWVDNANNEVSYEVVRDGQVIATLPADAVSFTDSNLKDATAYSYVVRAANRGGKSQDSNVASEMTLPYPPAAPTALTAVAKSQTEIVLTWVDNANNEVSYEVVRDGQVVATLPADAVSFTDSNLKDATAYSYVISAANRGGKSQDSNVASETTLPYPPAAPSGLALTVNGQTRIVLNWVDNANNEVSYEVIRDGQVIATLAADAASYSDSGLNSDTTYSYVVRCANRGGQTASSAVSGKTLPYPPAAPTGLSASATSWNSVTLKWADNANNEVSVEVYGANAASGPYTLLATLPANSTSYVETGLLPLVTRYYKVRMVNSGGSSDYSADATVTTPKFTGEYDNPTVSSNWAKVNSTSAIGGSYYSRDRNSSSDPAVWTYNVPVAGLYDVWVFIPTNSKLSTQARYDISTALGTITIPVDQRHSSGWVCIGVYYLTAGQNTVKACQSNNSTNPVAVDALRVNQIPLSAQDAAELAKLIKELQELLDFFGIGC